ncbi:MAG: MaoC family dehydratase [Candidatus Eremiobacteraeota bacterium]|nr:MaoC family dehydratase [Candidatus Eremiobacteraeota bacterium]
MEKTLRAPAEPNGHESGRLTNPSVVTGLRRTSEFPTSDDALAGSRYYIGQTASITRTVSGADIGAFAWATGDINPIHMDEAYASRTRFKRRIAHGMLVGSYISALLGTTFPGPGTIYMSQGMRFMRPVYVGDTIKVVATVTAYRPEKQILTIRTDCYNQDGEHVITGEAVCLVSDVAEPEGSPAREAAG